jgi:hypothetical protein
MRPTLMLCTVITIVALVISGHGYTGQIEHGDNSIQVDNAWARRPLMLG